MMALEMLDPFEPDIPLRLPEALAEPDPIFQLGSGKTFTEQKFTPPALGVATMTLPRARIVVVPLEIKIFSHALHLVALHLVALLVALHLIFLLSVTVHATTGVRIIVIFHAATGLTPVLRITLIGPTTITGTSG